MCENFLVMVWFGSRRRILPLMVAWLRLRALGQELVSRLCAMPVVVLNALRKKRQLMLEPQWFWSSDAGVFS
jgi:hypothetical protein